MRLSPQSTYKFSLPVLLEANQAKKAILYSEPFHTMIENPSVQVDNFIPLQETQEVTTLSTKKIIIIELDPSQIPSSYK